MKSVFRMRILERLIPGRTPVQLGKKLIFDQGIFTPPLIAAFFTINERKRIENLQN